MNRELADHVLGVMDRFLIYIIENFDTDKNTLVITSDHGNLEDLSTKTHTRNSVPLFVLGNMEPFKNTESILDITPAILKVLTRISHK